MGTDLLHRPIFPNHGTKSYIISHRDPACQSPDSFHVYMVCGNRDCGLLPNLLVHASGSWLVNFSFRFRFVGTDLRGFPRARQLAFIEKIIGVDHLLSRPLVLSFWGWSRLDWKVVLRSVEGLLRLEVVPVYWINGDLAYMTAPLRFCKVSAVH